MWKLSFLAAVALGTGTAAAATGLTQGELIMQAAVAASNTDPAKWDWPPDVAPQVRTEIAAGHYTREELRNIFTTLARFSGRSWPTRGPQATDPSTEILNAPGYIMHGRGFRGLEAFYGSNGYGGVSDRVNKIDAVIADGDQVFISWIIEGRHTDKLFGFPGDGKQLEVRESSLTRLKDGQVVETNPMGDDFALYTQAGGKVSFPDTTPRPAAPAAPAAAGGPSRADIILQAAVVASHQDPGKWDWPPSATADVRQQILTSQHTPEELRNIFTALAARYRGPAWPTKGPRPTNPSQAGLEAPGFVMHGHGFRGLEAFFGSNGYGGIADRVDTIDILLAHGDRVYVSWIINGHHTGNLFGFPGDGKEINVRESSMTRYQDGRMVEADYIGDDFALYTQAGGKVSFPDQP
jgi:predicted ester cyclase